MKLHCTIEVFDRSTFLKRKSQRAILAFLKKSAKCDDVYLYLQTRQNMQGTMYKIFKNTYQVFKRFITEGKATISLITPCHDLIIQSDIIQLKSFLHILERITNGYYENINQHILMSTTSFNSKDFFPLEKRKVVVKTKADYPVLQGFPKVTEQLFLRGLGRMSFDRQILTLQSLRTLDLSKNKISVLPKELGKLPHLQHLYISENSLGMSRPKWAWLEQIAIQNNLLSLDISNNGLLELPPQIGKLNNLVTLKVCQNALKELPQSIGNLQCLKYLDVANNALSCLPGTIKHLRLQSIDISDNHNLKFHGCEIGRCVEKAKRTGLPSLVECAAKSIIKSRLIYDIGLIPFTLVKYLDEAKYCCLCRNACFDYYFKYFIYLSLITTCNEIRATTFGKIGSDCYFCSSKCARFNSVDRICSCKND